MKTSGLIRSLLPLTALLAGAPLLTVAARAQAVEGAMADAKGDATKVMLKELDGEIDRLDDLLDNAPTPEEKAAAKARLETLKQRRNELRKTYVQARYDGLKADVKVEYNKFSAWTKKAFSSSPDAKLERKMDRAADKAEDMVKAAGEAKADALATVNSAAVATTTDLAAYKVNPTDENKADVKASLAALDTEIDRLDQRADALPRGDERTAAQLRVKALKERRSELASDFRKARFDALKSDVKAEWNKIVH